MDENPYKAAVASGEARNDVTPAGRPPATVVGLALAVFVGTTIGLTIPQVVRVLQWMFP